VLDANILIRAIFGTRVRDIIERFENEGNFFSPDVCFGEARRYIPDLCKKRRLDTGLVLTVLDHLSKLVLPVDRALYAGHEQEARRRIEYPGTLTIGLWWPSL
jgi:hypothetical protein